LKTAKEEFDSKIDVMREEFKNEMQKDLANAQIMERGLLIRMSMRRGDFGGAFTLCSSLCWLLAYSHKNERDITEEIRMMRDLYNDNTNSFNRRDIEYALNNLSRVNENHPNIPEVTEFIGDLNGHLEDLKADKSDNPPSGSAATAKR
jgi:hypothetical protein